VPRLGSRAAYVKQLLRDKLLDHKAYVREHGVDMPEVLNWQWGKKAVTFERVSALDTSADQ
jgi:xylulose-5-phosphate/fructose-6-phosphate phosphoketolase